MELEKRRKIGLPAREEAAHEKGQRPQQRQKDNDEDIGDRRREIVGQLTPDNEQCVGHLMHRGDGAKNLIQMASRDVDLFDDDVMVAHRDPYLVEDLRAAFGPDEEPVSIRDLDR